MPQPGLPGGPAAGDAAVVSSVPEWLTALRLHPATGRFDAVTDDDNVVFDRFVRSQRTAREVWRRAPYVWWMLGIARTHADWLLPAAWRALRAFAYACAAGEASEDAGMNSPATSFDADAAARGEPAALARLVAFHATDPDPLDAAFWAAEFAARRQAYLALAGRAAGWTCRDSAHGGLDRSWHLAHFVHHHPHAFAAMAMQGRARKAVLLRSVLPDPFGEFGANTRVHVFFEGRSDSPRRMYCVTCATGLRNMSPAVLLDGRWSWCGGCGAKLLTRAPRKDA
jgi:hypothetical protein